MPRLISIAAGLNWAPLAIEDQVVLVDASGAARSVKFGDATRCLGNRVTFKKVDSSGNAVTVGCQGAQTIDGATTVSLSAQWKYVTGVSDGANWLIVANN